MLPEEIQGEVMPTEGLRQALADGMVAEVRAVEEASTGVTTRLMVENLAGQEIDIAGQDVERVELDEESGHLKLYAGGAAVLLTLGALVTGVRKLRHDRLK